MFYCFFFLWHRRSFPRGPPPGKNLEGWLGFTEGFTGFTKFWRVLLGFAGFYGFYGFYWILLAFSGFYWVLRCFTVFYWVLLGFTGFYWVLLAFSGFYWVLLGFTGFYRDWVKIAAETDALGGQSRRRNEAGEILFRSENKKAPADQIRNGRWCARSSGRNREGTRLRSRRAPPPANNRRYWPNNRFVSESPLFFLSLSSAPLPFVTRFFIGRFQVDRCYWVSFLVVWLLDFTALYWMTDRFCSGHLPFFPYSGRFLPSSCSFFLAIAWSYRVCTGFRLCWV